MVRRPLRCVARRFEAATAGLSQTCRSHLRGTRFTQNGRSVARPIERICSRSAAGSVHDAPRVPRPPACDTATASGAAAPRPSGACITGTSQPSTLTGGSVQAGCRPPRHRRTPPAPLRQYCIAREAEALSQGPCFGVARRSSGARVHHGLRPRRTSRITARQSRAMASPAPANSHEPFSALSPATTMHSTKQHQKSGSLTGL